MLQRKEKRVGRGELSWEGGRWKMRAYNVGITTTRPTSTNNKRNQHMSELEDNSESFDKKKGKHDLQMSNLMGEAIDQLCQAL